MEKEELEKYLPTKDQCKTFKNALAYFYDTLDKAGLTLLYDYSEGRFFVVDTKKALELSKDRPELFKDTVDKLFSDSIDVYIEIADASEERRVPWFCTGLDDIKNALESKRSQNT